MDGRLITAKEVAEDLECSMQHAYKIVRQLNAELTEMGCFTMRGKTNRSYWTCYTFLDSQMRDIGR